MSPSIVLGRIFGVRVGVNWSWFVVLALIVWSLDSTVFPSQDPGLSDRTYLGMAIVAAALFFTSLLLHELGHARQARREGMQIEGITLWLFGGVAQFRGMFPSAGAEFRIAIAGPIVSAVIGVAALLVAAAVGFSTPVDGVAFWLGYINLMLLGFNLLPALPLDGGRVLRALLWKLRGDFRWATWIASDIGRGIGFLMIAGGLLLFFTQGAVSGAWLAFVGWFLLQAASIEGRYAILRDALGDLRVRDLMSRNPITVQLDETLAEFMDSVAHRHHFTTYPVTDDGHVVGLLPFGCVARVPRRDWDSTRVRDCMLELEAVPLIHEDEPLIEAVEQLGRGNVDRALVLDGDQLVGLLSVTDVARLLAAPPPRRKQRQ